MKKFSLDSFFDQFSGVTLGKKVKRDIESGEAKRKIEREREKIREKERTTNWRKVVSDFVYGKPHEERRLGDLYIKNTGLYKHREWRGIVDTMYYFNRIWLYNYLHMVLDIFKSDEPLTFFKGVFRYRWMANYLAVPMMVDRFTQGLRGEYLRMAHEEQDLIIIDVAKLLNTLARGDRRTGTEGQRLALPRHGFRDHTSVHADVFCGYQTP